MILITSCKISGWNKVDDFFKKSTRLKSSGLNLSILLNSVIGAKSLSLPTLGEKSLDKKTAHASTAGSFLYFLCTFFPNNNSTCPFPFNNPIWRHHTIHPSICNIQTSQLNTRQISHGKLSSLSFHTKHGDILLSLTITLHICPVAWTHYSSPIYLNKR